MLNKKILIFFLMISCFTSCNLEDDSQSVSGVDVIDAKELLGSSIRQVAFNQSAIGGRSAAVIMEYLQENDASILFYRNYRLGPATFDHMWSEGFYSGSLASLHEMRTIATEENEEDLVAISLILLAHEYSTLTNMFGDIPFTDALQRGGIVKPRFDDQKEVYEKIVDMLDEAIAIIGNKEIIQGLSNEDLIYQGDFQGWKKLACGLKARFLLNQRNQNPGFDDEIIELINNSFENSGEQANFNYNPIFRNPQYSYAVERPRTLRTGEYFLDQLLSTEDPRQSFFTIFIVNLQWDYFDFENFTSNWFTESETIPLLSYTELLFIRAELSIYLGADQNETSSLLREAITSSMLDNGINLSDSTLNFITTNSNLNGLTDQEKLQRIMEQSYVAYYGHNHLQAWNNYRRTGYPGLVSTASGPNEYNPSAVVPRRFIYPQSEFDYNSDNVNEAIFRQEGALLDNDIWIFK